MGAVAILRAARARIADPAKWTAGTMARDANGVACAVHDPNAVCWCLMGAVTVERGGDGERDLWLLENAADDLFGTFSISAVNDRHGHAAALRLLDRAIEIAEAE